MKDKGECHFYFKNLTLPLINRVGEMVCNVPTLGHHCITEFYDDQSSQMEVIANTGARILGSGLHRSSYFIIMIHSA
jgi:hypothetical protein